MRKSLKFGDCNPRPRACEPQVRTVPPAPSPVIFQPACTFCASFIRISPCLNFTSLSHEKKIDQKKEQTIISPPVLTREKKNTATAASFPSACSDHAAYPHPVFSLPIGNRRLPPIFTDTAIRRQPIPAVNFEKFRPNLKFSKIFEIKKEKIW